MPVRRRRKDQRRRLGRNESMSTYKQVKCTYNKYRPFFPVTTFVKEPSRYCHASRIELAFRPSVLLGSGQRFECLLVVPRPKGWGECLPGGEHEAATMVRPEFFRSERCNCQPSPAVAFYRAAHSSSKFSSWKSCLSVRWSS